jgi:hypothetical protein
MTHRKILNPSTWTDISFQTAPLVFLSHPLFFFKSQEQKRSTKSKAWGGDKYDEYDEYDDISDTKNGSQHT